MGTYSLAPITTDEQGENIPPPLESGEDHIPYRDRQRCQTLMNVNTIYRAPNGYFSLSCKLPDGVKFNLLHTDGTSSIKEKPLLLAARIHLHEPNQLGGLAVLSNKFPEYWESLVGVVNSTALSRYMDESIRSKYWPKAWLHRRDASMHGNSHLDLILTCHKTDDTFRAHIPKQWSRLLLGRISPIDAMQQNAAEFVFKKKYTSPEAFKKGLEREESNILRLIDNFTRNTLLCEHFPNCTKRFNSRRKLYEHLVQKHGGVDDNWPIMNPIEPFISIRRAELPPLFRGHESLHAFPELYTSDFHQFEFMSHVARSTKKAYFLSIPNWVKRQILDKYPSIYGNLKTTILWHSPAIKEIQRETPGRSKTELPINWNEKEPVPLLKDPVTAYGRYDKKSNYLIFESEDNNMFIDWIRQGIAPRTIVYVSIEVDIPRYCEEGEEPDPRSPQFLWR